MIFDLEFLDYCSNTIRKSREGVVQHYRGRFTKYTRPKSSGGRLGDGGDLPRRSAPTIVDQALGVLPLLESKPVLSKIAGEVEKTAEVIFESKKRRKEEEENETEMAVFDEKLHLRRLKRKMEDSGVGLDSGNLNITGLNPDTPGNDKSKPSIKYLATIATEEDLRAAEELLNSTDDWKVDIDF